MRRTCLLYQSDRPIPYLSAWQWQKQLVEERKQARREGIDLPDVLLLIEHPAVYTLGQGSSLEFLKFNLEDHNIECHRIERGGEVTHHAIGQLVAYPILNLDYHQHDLHWYLRQLEEVIIQVLAKFGLSSQRIQGLTGVWINKSGQNQKIAQVGIKVSQWITMHGFALNVNMDLSGFDRIVPCGITDCQVCNLNQFVPDVRVEQVKIAIAQTFAQIFNLEMQLPLSTSL
ncbi:octanoate-[acyl-carrier-protein]-protein-N-octanoyltransferase [Pseudanabaena sp. lw0831]|uniref:lipoyl(octanoyl) transferase LipB n=1 Tax=Pseudanabaena sp. lw0831 TaxID=1357935 RepID=UPI001915CD97|nr:lipoyl(octanoyl) transferase LipB [Pseudanabaena sp. lw0831]GBO53097.1 octanoate-[acyl-carrier-protein]-protein-N-octanoyltransferase [Pseudanabaena sp. lw0831]